MKTKILSLFIVLGLVVSSCDLDLLENPNVVTAATASPNFLLTRIQVDFAAHFGSTTTNSVSGVGMRLTRMINQPNANYEQAYVPQNFNTIWSRSYSSILNDIEFMMPLAEEANFRRHMGIAKVIKAYVLMTLVDTFGDIPYSEALDANILNPGRDSGADVYAAALAILQDAKTDFQAETAGSPVDFFYGNNAGRWLRLISTLELRYHLNTKLVNASGATSAINALIAEDNLLRAGDDFVFQYGVSNNDPDARHPRYWDHYTVSGASGDYHNNYYMYQFLDFGPKGINDPRARYYFYRQVGEDTTDPDELRCISEFAPAHLFGWPFCLPNSKAGSRGYWGRDHLNNEGIPPDGFQRTAWGLYPAGGAFDDDRFSSTFPGAGAGGAGIQPIMLASFVDFMLAEAASTLNTSGNAKDLLLSGVQKHMDYVRDWATGTAEGGAIDAWETDTDYDWDDRVTGYLNVVSDQYDAASNKMSVIGTEYWLALYGNGIEAYNLYRRTGQPGGMQPGMLASFGEYPRSIPYPNNYVTTNLNADAKPDGFSTRVFWDTNPASGFPNGFIY